MPPACAQPGSHAAQQRLASKARGVHVAAWARWGPQPGRVTVRVGAPLHAPHLLRAVAALLVRRLLALLLPSLALAVLEVQIIVLHGEDRRDA